MDEILRWGMLGLLGAMVAAGLVSLYLPRSQTNWRCPGAPLGWRKIRPSRNWFIHTRCWHRLDGLEADVDLSVRCPECGTRITTQRRLSAGCRFRFESLAVVFLVFSLASGLSAAIRGGNWSNGLPALPLVMLAQADYFTHRTAFRRDLAARNHAGHLSKLSGSILAWKLIKDFRDDEQSWNADVADSQMGAIGEAGIAALRWEFLNGDDQSKSICLKHLRRIDKDPPRRMIEIARRGILTGDEKSRKRFMHYLGTFDEAPSGELIDLWILNSAIDYLKKHFDTARPKMIQVLKTGTVHEKYLFAITFTELLDREMLPLAIDILATHLEDNDTMHDQKEIIDALSSLGPIGLPLLEPYMETLDLQGRYSLGHIKRSIRKHDSTTWEQWYELPEEKRSEHQWGPWSFLWKMREAP
jgi:DNA-directed RNA polymerase subunit RPC12/RpoP